VQIRWGSCSWSMFGCTKRIWSVCMCGATWKPTTGNVMIFQNQNDLAPFNGTQRACVLLKDIGEGLDAWARPGPARLQNLSFLDPATSVMTIVLSGTLHFTKRVSSPIKTSSSSPPTLLILYAPLSVPKPKSRICYDQAAALSKRPDRA
jgi:hypothetical protein